MVKPLHKHSFLSREEWASFPHLSLILSSRYGWYWKCYAFPILWLNRQGDGFSIVCVPWREKKYSMAGPRWFKGSNLGSLLVLSARIVPSGKFSDYCRSGGWDKNKRPIRLGSLRQGRKPWTEAITPFLKKQFISPAKCDQLQFKDIKGRLNEALHIIFITVVIQITETSEF